MPIDRAPIGGVTLEQFYEARVRAGGYFAPDGGEAVAVAMGLDPAAWQRARPAWEAREQGHLGDPELMDLHFGTMDRIFGVLAEIDVLAYADMNVQVHRNGGDLGAAAATLGMNALVFQRDSMKMVERMAAEPRVQAHYNVAYARSKALGGQAVRKLRGDAARPANRPDGAVTRQRKEPKAGLSKLRARRCGHCGAYKVKAHDRCWLYCDRCGALFDYDATKIDAKELAAAEETALELRMCLENERVPKDPEKRAAQRLEGERWMRRILVELYPLTYPARVADPEYREALVQRWLVPASICWASSSRCHATGEAVTRAFSKLVGKKKPGSDLINELYDATVAHAEAQAAEADAAGIFGAHPDPLTPALWIHQNKSAFVHSFGPKLPPADREALIDRAGLREEFVPSTPAQLQAMACPCGAELDVPVGALRVLCESCGLLHDCAATRPCVSCGATLVGGLANAGPVTCPYCQTQWAPA